MLSKPYFTRVPPVFRIDITLIYFMILLLTGNAQAAPPAPVAVTGQTTSYLVGDDGELRVGVSWPTPRFVDNNDGTVTDLLTGLIWLRDAGCIGLQDWYASLAKANILENGMCGLSDSSVPGNWRLPNVPELFSLIDLGNSSPSLPVTNPFNNISSEFYWTSTTLVSNNVRARPIHVGFGMIDQRDKTTQHYVWPVRDP